MISREDIVSEIQEEIDELLAAAPENLLEAAREAIRTESIEYARRILDALSSKELQSPLALERFIETTLAQARMSMHMR